MSPRRLVLAVLAPAAGLLAAAVLLVDGGPGDALGVFPGTAFLALAFLDVLGLALLLVGIGRLVSAWHGVLLARAGLRSSRRAGCRGVSAAFARRDGGRAVSARACPPWRAASSRARACRAMRPACRPAWPPCPRARR